MIPRSFLRGLLATLLVIPSITQASRAKCSSIQCCYRRDFTPRINRDLSTSSSIIIKLPRALTEIANDRIRSEFVSQTVNSLASNDKIYNDLRPSAIKSTSIWRPFTGRGKYRQTSFKVGLRYLSGCTAIVMIGHGGIWAAHFFEDSGMDPENEGYVRKLLSSGSQKFDSFTNHFLELNGSPKSGPGDPPEVFIITPAKGLGGPPVNFDPKLAPDIRSSDEIGYDDTQRQWPEAYDDIHREIQSHWPLLSIREHRYHALNKDNSLDRSKLRYGPEGKILFEYDSNGKGTGEFEIRLHLENNEVLRTVLPTIWWLK